MLRPIKTLVDVAETDRYLMRRYSDQEVAVEAYGSVPPAADGKARTKYHSITWGWLRRIVTTLGEEPPRMTPNITREEIENRQDGALAQAKEASAQGDRDWHLRTAAIFDYALAGLAVQPRPICEAPRDGTRVLGVNCEFGRTGIYVMWWGEYTPDQIASWMNYEAQGYNPTHFIRLSSLPLSSLPETKP